MTNPLTTEDRLALQSLVARYALAVDTGDFEALRAVFVADAELDTGRSVRRGVDEIVTAMEGLRRYEATHHLVGQHVLDTDTDTDTDRASGVAYCTAHHLAPNDTGRTDMVMYIRYHDEYRRTSGGWRIATRRLDVVGTRTDQID